jgi:hypothetical protein
LIGRQTLVGTLIYDSKANTWRLRYVGANADDRQVGEVTLRGLEPYVNSLKDHLTVSIRGDVSAAATKSQVPDFTVLEVNIVGQ